METQLDKALVAAQQDASAKKTYFETILNTAFFVPTDNRTDGQSAALEAQAGDEITPLVLKHGERPYLLLFDTHDRMLAWAGQEIAHVQLPGYVLAEMTKGDLFWALNVGTEHPYELNPDQVNWLHQEVQKAAKN